MCGYTRVVPQPTATCSPPCLQTEQPNTPLNWVKFINLDFAWRSTVTHMTIALSSFSSLGQLKHQHLQYIISEFIILGHDWLCAVYTFDFQVFAFLKMGQRNWNMGGACLEDHRPARIVYFLRNPVEVYFYYIYAALWQYICDQICERNHNPQIMILKYKRL